MRTVIAGGGMVGLTLARLLRACGEDPVVLEEVQRNVDEANKRFARVEQIKKFTLLGEEWLPDSDELTPTMKLKRRPIDEKYGAEIDALYAG